VSARNLTRTRKVTSADNCLKRGETAVARRIERREDRPERRESAGLAYEMGWIVRPLADHAVVATFGLAVGPVPLVTAAVVRALAGHPSIDQEPRETPTQPCTPAESTTTEVFHQQKLRQAAAFTQPIWARPRRSARVSRSRDA
jgi:hypothetical protein